MRRTFQIFRSKLRLVQKFQFKLSKQIIVKRNFRYLNNLNIERFLDRHSIEKDIDKDGANLDVKKDYIIDFNSELDWEDSVLRSLIPVVVNFYAE